MTSIAPPLTAVVVPLGDEVAEESVLEGTLGILLDHDSFFDSTSFRMRYLDSKTLARFTA